MQKKNIIHQKRSRKQQKNIMEVYDQNQFEVTESLLYYLNNSASVEILTKGGLLMKVYFSIPKQCTLLSQSLMQKLLDEMMETNPRESIKYICYKALLLKERLGVQKKGNRFTELSRFVVNNITRLSSISFFLLFLYLIFEIWRNISDNSLADLLLSVTIF